MTAAIEIRGLRKRFGAKAAVDGLDLVVAPGEFLALLGPNGAGKTTTLRLVAGLLSPDAASSPIVARSSRARGSATAGGTDQRPATNARYSSGRSLP